MEEKYNQVIIRLINDDEVKLVDDKKIRDNYNGN